MVIKEIILRDLRNAIVMGELKPGQRITESAISSQFGVSRTPVREIFKQLEREWLVSIDPNVGARVVDFSAKDVSCIYDVLIILEGGAARLACSQVGEEQISKLRQCQFLIERAMVLKQLDLLFELNIRFHMMITEFTRNPHLIAIRKNFDGLVIRFGRLATFIPQHLNVTMEEHPRIIDAITKRNAALSEYFAREHMEKAKAYVLDYIQDLQKGGGDKKVFKNQTTYYNEI